MLPFELNTIFALAVAVRSSMSVRLKIVSFVCIGSSFGPLCVLLSKFCAILVVGNCCVAAQFGAADACCCTYWCA